MDDLVVQVHGNPRPTPTIFIGVDFLLAHEKYHLMLDTIPLRRSDVLLNLTHLDVQLLLTAAVEGDLARAELLISKGANVNCKDTELNKFVSSSPSNSDAHTHHHNQDGKQTPIESTSKSGSDSPAVVFVYIQLIVVSYIYMYKLFT